MKPSEEWRFIPGFSKNYMVSNLGNVKSLERIKIRSNGRPQKIRERILKCSCDEWGYPQVRIDGKTVKVHRVVALAFLGDRPDSCEIRHLDGNPMNSKASNLKYGSHSQNVLDGYKYNGYISKRQKLNPEKAKTIRKLLKLGKKSRDIAKMHGVSEQTICDIKHNRIYNTRKENKQ